MHNAYFAGLIDGEGYMGFYSRGTKQSSRLIVGVNMTCEKTLRFLHKRFGGQFGPRETKQPNKKPQWLWRCVGHDAIAVLKAIRPYSITRRADIVRLLETKRAYGGK